MRPIHSMFENLKPEKQATILNAALEEFVQKGFDQASTNAIVREAEISKGSLFNYFPSKKDLYLYLVDYSLQIMDQLIETIDLEESDLFQRIEAIGLNKIQIQQSFPQVFDFLLSAKHEEAEEVQALTKERITSAYEKIQKHMYDQIDKDKFRPDLDMGKAMEILNWTLSAFGEKSLQQMDSFEDLNEFGEHYLKEWKSYAQILKESFYK